MLYNNLMGYILLFIIAVVLLIVIVVLLLPRRAQDKVVGICEAALGQSKKKKENKAKILGLLAQKGEVSNSDIRETLEVSDRTVVRYMNELEEEDKVEQIGETGHYTTYRLK